MTAPADLMSPLASQLQDLAARRDIADAACRYMRGLDRLDRAMLLSAFHADAYVDCGLMQGDAAAFGDFALDLLGGMHATHHLLGQMQIVVLGPDRASAESYFQAYHDIAGPAGDRRDLVIAGRYVDEYTCNKGEWRIAARTLITDWVTDRPGNRAFFADNPAAPVGRRDGRDFSDTRQWPPKVMAMLARPCGKDNTQAMNSEAS
ncbi:nuclear transport factor 2 family protein [Croceicoccus sp. F390]|uniref:Nuclear transport factor 2 family protein n=1 Tax=Croceicoccus esteveae TaxID=3075597 RepID=A0ABU2ZHB7_9SPHN|nr:nuclear transport factor 2 family protein [Croceicoccus sp. F390]MDT0575995.1 nuclear transport factor 2 family protein [Croceicoccus sp. F390]